MVVSLTPISIGTAGNGTGGAVNVGGGMKEGVRLLTEAWPEAVLTDEAAVTP